MNIVKYLSSLLSVDVDRLNKFISTSPYRYKVYEIAKRSDKGSRVIAQPSKELKQLQRLVLSKYLADLPIHESCMAYRKGKSIKDNAIVHVRSRFLLKMDFSDFFPSIVPKDLICHIKKHRGVDVSEEDEQVLARLLFYKKNRNAPLRLSVGAPTSPFISNTLMFEFDTKIAMLCKEKGVLYTRYADDISFSTNTKGLLFEFEADIRKALDECEYPDIKINNAKTVFLSRKQNMHITGLVLSNDGKISIGRKKKRYIKSLVYRYISGDIDEELKGYLAGYLSFCRSVEPEFVAMLTRKYSKKVIDSVEGRVQDP